MAFKRFAWIVIARTLLLLITLIFLAWLLGQDGYVVNTIFVVFAAIAQTWSLIHYVDRTNTELARFLNSIRHSDFIQSFSIEHLGSGFQELNEAFDDIMQRFRAARSEKEVQARYLKTVLEHTPVAIIAVYEQGEVELLNNAARKLLNAPGQLNVDDLLAYGPKFQQDVRKAEAGQTRLTSLFVENEEQQIIISTTEMTVEGKRQLLISLQDIQSHLDARELSAWQDLVRVLSHEIMNSITPISSLARTSADMVHDVEESIKKHIEDPDLISDFEDIHDGVRTIARRSEGLMHFVKSYRQLTQMAPPTKKRVDLNDYISRLETLMRSEWVEDDIQFNVDIPQQKLWLNVDEELLDQALINLLTNARHAVLGVEKPQIILGVKINERSRIVIEISDNGAGIDPEKAEKIFLPFFTTKSDGTGIGLALTRQIMLAHSGTISAGKADIGGAVFRLTF